MMNKDQETFDPAESSVTASEIRKQLQHEVRMEVEFVLSEEGLSQFTEIAELVKKSQTQSAPIDVLLTIPRLTKIGVTRTDFLNSVSESDIVEIDGDGTGIRRKNVKPLQQLDIDVGPTKKQKTEKASANGKGKKHDDESHKVVEPKLFKITLNEPIKMKDSKFRSELEKHLGKEIAFARLYGTEGYFAIDASDATESDKMKVAHMDITLGNAVAKIQECWDDDLDKFYQRNGNGLDSYLERAGKRRKEKGEKNEVDLVFYANKYNDIAPLAYIFQGILSKNFHEKKINKADEQMLMELLRYHESFDKIKEIDHFEVGFHPKNESMLTFFAVTKKGEKEPFSFEECTENLLDHFIEPKKQLQKA